MQSALHRNELEVFFQPQVKLADLKCVGLEALLRWKHPDLGYISPDLFIPVAEQQGLIREIGSWVLTTVCHQGSEWLEQGLDFGRIAVNISGIQIRQKDFAKLIENTLKKTGLPADKLELELTESYIMSDVEDNITQLSSLRDLGVHVSIDDFGTGYSSLGYLKQLPVNKLKIDRSFVKDIDTDVDSYIITRSIVALAKAMHLEVIAEGVENQEHSKQLTELGCELVQGFLYSKAIPAEQVKEWLSSSS